MKAYTYVGPDGESVEKASAEDVRRALRRGKGYWHGGSGSALIARAGKEEGETAYPELHVIVHKPHGVHLLYARSENASNLVTFDDSQPPRKVKHQIGGNDVAFPRQSFVPPAVAERVIEDFFRTGKPSPAVAWRVGRFETDTEFEYVEGK